MTKVLYIQEKGSGRTYQFREGEILQIGPYTPLEDLSTFLMDSIGWWRIELNSGRIFDAQGTPRDYDYVLKVIIRRMSRGKV